jgi:DNA-binding transcriptional MocR family regulator
VVWPKKRISEETAIADVASRGVGVCGVGRYFLRRPSRSGILLGYPRLREAEIREGVRRLAEIL